MNISNIYGHFGHSEHVNPLWMVSNGDVDHEAKGHDWSKSINGQPQI